MKPSRNFFEILRQKLEKQPRKEFDTQFWAAFESKFQNKKVLRPSFLRPLWLVPAFSTMALIVMSVAYFRWDGKKNDEVLLAQSVISQSEMLSDLELLDTFAELPVSDEEWALLDDSKPEDS